VSISPSKVNLSSKNPLINVVLTSLAGDGFGSKIVQSIGLSFLSSRLNIPWDHPISNTDFGSCF